MIKLVNVSKIYPDRGDSVVALRNVDLEVNRGDFLGIVGPSGSGKTTLLSLMGCLLLPTGGEVVFDGESVSALSEKERAVIRSRKIGFVFQEIVLMEGLRVWENVVLPRALAGERGSRELAGDMLGEVGLQDKIDSRPAVLSFGQRKRVAIARALVTDAPVILADEPTGGLDRETAEAIFNILVSANRERGKTVVFVTHDDYFAGKADRRMEIRDGKLVI
ncbi:MAG: ABC transporter ATP-binding protein [bacterium]